MQATVRYKLASCPSCFRRKKTVKMSDGNRTCILKEQTLCHVDYIADAYRNVVFVYIILYNLRPRPNMDVIGIIVGQIYMTY